MTPNPFLAFFERHERRCLYRIENEIRGHDARDLLQDAYLALWQSYLANTFDPSRPDAVGFLDQRIAWLIADFHKKPKVQPVGMYGSEEGGDATSLTEPADCREAPPWYTTATAEAQTLLQSRIQQLSQDARQVIVLKLAGVSYDEMAETLGITRATCRQRYHRALESLRESIGDNPLPAEE